MATTIWKGHLSFGLVSVPVKLSRAARAEKFLSGRCMRPPAREFVRHFIVSRRNHWKRSFRRTRV